MSAFVIRRPLMRKIALARGAVVRSRFRSVRCDAMIDFARVQPAARLHESISVWRLRRHAVPGLIRPAMRWRLRFFAESFGASGVGCGGGTPDLRGPSGASPNREWLISRMEIWLDQGDDPLLRSGDAAGDAQDCAGSRRGRPRPPARPRLAAPPAREVIETHNCGIDSRPRPMLASGWNVGSGDEYGTAGRQVHDFMRPPVPELADAMGCRG